MRTDRHPLALGRIKYHMDAIGVSKVLTLITDNASNMKAARNLVKAESKYKRIIPLR